MFSLWLSMMFACTDPKNRDMDEDGFIASEDCDDDNPDVNPLAEEVCNEIDDDCDGEINNNPEDGLIYLADLDGDGAGDDNAQFQLCAQESGYVSIGDGGDCNDSDASIFPGNAELCNEIDDNCNGDIDEDPEDGILFYMDTDGDGYGNAEESVSLCVLPDGYVDNNTDCDDQSDTTYPGAAEFESETDCMTDADGDGFGSVDVEGSTIAGTDCDDVEGNIYPDASERCNGIDDDCDDLIDDADDSVVDMITVYLDADGDGYGDTDSIVDKCFPQANELEQAGDCNDSDELINPDASEICDGVDNDCDPNTSEEGMVHMWDAQGVGTDMTSSFIGTIDDPVLYETSEDMELYFCEGEYSIMIETTGDLDIQSIGDVTFEAMGQNLAQDSTFFIANTGDATTTTAEGFVVDGYYSAFLVGSENELDNTLSVDNVTIRNGLLPVFLNNGEVNISNSYIEESESALFFGAINIFNGDLNIDAVDVSSTLVEPAIGVLVSEGTLTMNNSTISNATNSSISLVNSAGACTNSSATMSSGVSGSDIGVNLSGSTWESTACDYELETSADENDVDVRIVSGPSYYVDNNATFSCSLTRCGTQYTQSYIASSEGSLSGREYANAYTADVDLTIDSFTTYLKGAGCGFLFNYPCACDLNFSMHMKEQGVWVEKWSNDRSSFMNGNVSSGDIGVPVRTGEDFALSVDFLCDFTVDYYYDTASSVPSLSLLSYDRSYNGAAGGGISASNWSENSFSYYDQIVKVTRVP